MESCDTTKFSRLFAWQSFDIPWCGLCHIQYDYSCASRLKAWSSFDISIILASLHAQGKPKVTNFHLPESVGVVLLKRGKLLSLPSSHYHINPSSVLFDELDSLLLTMPPLSAMDGESPMYTDNDNDSDNSESSTMDAATPSDDVCNTVLYPEPATAFSTSNPLARRRRISFAPSVEVREIAHLKDLSPEEVTSTWYNNSDFEVIKQSIVNTLRLVMACRRPLDDDDHCIRGLEPRIPILAKFRKASRINCLAAVWNQQVISWQAGTINEEAIATACRAQSLTCQIIARRAAVHDEQASKLNWGNNDNDDGGNDHCDDHKTNEATITATPTTTSTTMACQKMEFILIENLVSLSQGRRQAVRDDIRHFVDNDRSSGNQHSQSSSSGTTTTTTTTKASTRTTQQHTSRQSVPVAV